MPPMVGHSVRRGDTCDQTVMDSPPTKAAAKTALSLLHLPAELRAMIYKPLIQAGDLSILRVSKHISQDAVPLLSSVAILRVTIGRKFSSDVTLPLTATISLSGVLTLTAPNVIQNLNLRIDLAPIVEYPVNAGLIQCFGGSQIARGSCHIIMRFGVFGLIPTSAEIFKIYEWIAALTGFKKLTLKLEYFIKDILGDPTSDGLATTQLILQKMLLEDCDEISEYLMQTLGPAKVNDTPNGRCLSFLPRDHKLCDSLNVDS